MMPRRKRPAYVPYSDHPAQRYQLVEPSYTPLYFSASSGPVFPAAGGNMVQVRIRNPPGSGTALFIYKAVVWSQATREVTGLMLAGPNSANLVTTINVTSRKFPPEAPAGRASMTNANLAVVPATGVVFRHPVEGTTPWTWDEGIILRPDMVFEIRFADLLNVTTDNFNADLDWYELSDTVVQG